MKTTINKSKGFTLIELLVVIAIISLLSSIVMASLNSARAKARDAVRLSDMHQMQLALDMYFNQFGRYPSPDYAGPGGWDTPGNGSFITPLVVNGFLPTNLFDPVASYTDNYRYFRYNAGTNGCPTTGGAFYVLEVFNMETSGNPHPLSPGWSCSGQNWQNAYNAAWVTGKFEN